MALCCSILRGIDFLGRFYASFSGRDGAGSISGEMGRVGSEIIKGWVHLEIGPVISLKTGYKMGCCIDGLILGWEFASTWPNLGHNKIILIANKD